MAQKTSVNVSDLVLLTRAVITHNLRKCITVRHKINHFLARWKWFWAICHYFHALIRNVKYAINLIGDSAVCYVPI